MDDGTRSKVPDAQMPILSAEDIPAAANFDGKNRERAALHILAQGAVANREEFRELMGVRSR